ncbi:MAG: PAS domain S-box protein, partial [Methanobacteriaceae archaeon]|nr:PAS domain S-box protein [Methanobacteriaceae archaeon]
LDIIIVLDYQGDITYASPSLEKVFGYKVPEFLGFNIFDFIHHHDSLRLKEALKDNIKNSGSNVDFEVRCQHESGHWLSCQMVAQNLISDPAVRGIVLNIRDITQRKQAEIARNNLEEMYGALITASPDGFISIDLDGKINYVSEKAAFMMGWGNGKKLISETIFNIIIPEENELFVKNMKIVRDIGALRNIEHNAYKRDGDIFIAEMNMALTQDSKENPKGFIVTIRDITYRKKMEKKVRTSLKEKEILLKEVHHRVKNNMQIISSLIGLQSEHVHDKKTKELFEDSKNRIRSMALIHEKLYGSEGMEKVDFSEYLKSLVNSLERSYLHKNDIEIIIDVVDVSLDIDQAITCGLILNELISNSLKYAFPKNIISGDSYKSDILIGLKGNDISGYAENSSIETVNSDIDSLTTPLISITACSNEGKIIINVADNGVGLPKGINFENTESLGLQIVSTLVSQLEGTIILDNDYGARFIIEFKEKKF